MATRWKLKPKRMALWSDVEYYLLPGENGAVKMTGYLWLTGKFLSPMEQALILAPANFLLVMPKTERSSVKKLALW
ncbi:hypothetical protein DXT88_20265 [Herbaspirillum lusitanum]|nr:hypothetical protein [Herbaspirillum lusitanum]